jgi:hypothetical protein
VEYSGLQVRKLNFLINIGYNFERKFSSLGCLKRLLLDCSTAWPFLIILYVCYFFFRKNNGLVRNDFLDCMIELRQSVKDEMVGDVQSAKNASTGSAFSKLQEIFIFFVI